MILYNSSPHISTENPNNNDNHQCKGKEAQKIAWSQMHNPINQVHNNENNAENAHDTMDREPKLNTPRKTTLQTRIESRNSEQTKPKPI